MATDVKIRISAKDEASRVLAQVSGSLNQVRSVAATMGSALGLIGVAGVGGLVAMAKSAIDGLDALNDLSEATGASIENISALEDVAALTGTSFDTVGDALIKFNKALQSSTAGSPTEAALKAIGLSVKELKELDPAEALLKTAQALAGFADDGNKARLTGVLFGKSLKDVAPLLNDLAEKGRLNGTVTKEQAAEAKKFNEELFSLGKSVTDLARFLAGPLVSGINRSIEAFRQGAKEGKAWYTVMAESFGTDFRRWTNMPDNAQEYSARMADISEKLKDNNLHATRRAALLREQAALQAKLKAGPDLNADNGEAARLLARNPLNRPSVGDIPDKPTKPKAAAKEQVDDASRELATYVEGLQRQIDGTDKLTESQKALNVLRGLGATGEISQVRELVLGMAQRVDQEKELAEARKQGAASIDKQATELAALNQENTSLAERVETIGLTTEALNTLTLARMDATIAQEQELAAQMSMNNASTEEIALANQKIKLLQQQRDLTAKGQIAQASADTASEQDKASKDYAKTLENDVKGALSEAFRDTKDPLRAFGDALGNIVFTRITTALANSLVDGLFTKAAGGAAAGGLLGLLGFDGGGYTGSGSRSGGLDGKGGFVAMLHPQETVVDHTKGQQAPASQAVTVIQHFTVGDVASISMVRQSVANSERRIATALGRQQTYGAMA